MNDNSFTVIRKWLFLTAIVLVAGIFTAFPTFGEHFLLHMDAMPWSLVWQCFTCHLVHWTPEHYIYDAICFVAFAGTLSRRTLYRTLLVAAPVVAVVVFLWCPELRTYGGLSGVNCALFAQFTLQLDRKKAFLGKLFLVGILCKIVLEIVTDRTFFATTGFVPVHAAHLAGVAAGLLSSGCWLRSHLDGVERRPAKPIDAPCGG
ncbi:MAG: rhomboid family intramembrane serine protease [Victivallales bacterium]|nr:rhomboid family intramembrane serine protease [Victivallales bacterium]